MKPVDVFQTLHDDILLKQKIGNMSVQYGGVFHMLYTDRFAENKHPSDSVFLTWQLSWYSDQRMRSIGMMRGSLEERYLYNDGHALQWEKAYKKDEYKRRTGKDF